jgi:hypothetical protein
MAELDSTGIDTPCADYQASSTAWQVPRALMGGTRRMRAKGETYLPREQAEDQTAYKNRLNRSVLFNAFKKAVRDMRGRVFARPIKLGEDVPEQIVALCEDVDMAGRSLNTFAWDVFGDGLETGISFILVDMPTTLKRTDGRPVTLADERDAKRRPYFVHVRAEQLIGWSSTTYQGRETLTQVRILEEVTVPDGRFGAKCVEQIRVLEPGHYELWQKDTGGVWTLVEDGPVSIGRIPLAPIYINRSGFMTGSPPLADLADLNVSHWQKKSDLDAIVHVASVPVLFGTGFDENASIVIGSSTMTRATNPAAKLEYVEHSGRAIQAGRESLKDLETQMMALGLELLIPRPGDATATGRAIDAAAMHAPLQLMALALQDGLEQALGFAAEFLGLGQDAGGSVEVNRDYGVSMRDATDLQALIAACNAGYITPKRLLMEFQRRGVLADDMDPNAEAEEAADAPDAFNVPQAAE